MNEKEEDGASSECHEKALPQPLLFIITVYCRVSLPCPLFLAFRSSPLALKFTYFFICSQYVLFQQMIPIDLPSTRFSDVSGVIVCPGHQWQGSNGLEPRRAAREGAALASVEVVDSKCFKGADLRLRWGKMMKHELQSVIHIIYCTEYSFVSCLVWLKQTPLAHSPVPQCRFMHNGQSAIVHMQTCIYFDLFRSRLPKQERQFTGEMQV